MDVIISNCVINLSEYKAQVFREAYRVLRPGGRLCISDIVALRDMPEEMKKDMRLRTGCVSGAVRVDTLKKALEEAGFCRIDVTVNKKSRQFISQWFPGRGVEEFIASAIIQAEKLIAKP